MFEIYFKKHYYYLASVGTNLKGAIFDSRHDAEVKMNSYCAEHNITVECTECDKHSRKYSNHKGVLFFINRM